jgi:hypothetical protein
VAVSPSRVPSCKSVQGLPDTSAFSLRGTCERRQVLPMRLLLHLVCSRLAVILHFHSAPSRLSFSRCVHRRVFHPLTTRVLVVPPSIRDTTTAYFLSNIAVPCLLLNSLAGSFAANYPWETRCSWEIGDSWHEFDKYNPDPDPTCHSSGLLAITL